MAIEKRIGIYIGRRLTTKHKLAYFWLFGSDQRGYKKQIAPAVIGEAWNISFGTSEGENLIYLQGVNAPVRLTGQDAKPSEVTLWGAEDVAANEQYHSERELEKLKKRKQPFDKAMEPLI